MYNNRDSIDFAHEPVGRLFRKMFIPTLIGLVSMVVLNITDGAFVGHGVSSDALAAVNVVAPIFLIVSGLGLMFGIGSSVVASIHLSKGNTKAANINMTQGLLAATLLGIVLAFIFYQLQRPLCILFGSNEELIPIACSYLKWIAILTPFNLFGMVGMFMVRLDGSPRFAMVVNCSMAITNIILDYIFIYPLQMGLEGAAIATTISFSLGNIPLIIYFTIVAQTVKLYKLKTSLTSLKLTLRNLLYQIKVGASALLSEVAIATIMIAGNYVFMHYLGPNGVAAFSVGCYCLPIVFMMGNAIVQSVQPIVSFAHGNNDANRLAESTRIAIIVSLVTGITGMALMLSRPEDITSIFLPTNCEAYKLCTYGLPYFSPAFLFISFNIVAIGLMQSTEQALKATIFTILRGFIFSAICFISIPMLLGEAGLWFALPMAELLTIIAIVASYKIKISQK